MNEQELKTNLDLETILKEHDQKIWHIIYKSLDTKRIPRDHGQDVYQEVCIKLFKKLGEFDPAKSAITTYVWNVTKNTCMQYIREYFDNNHIEFDEERSSSIDAYEHRVGDLIERFQATPRYKKVIYMTIDGYKQQEIAKELELSQSTVSRVLSEFKDYLLESANN